MDQLPSRPRSSFLGAWHRPSCLSDAQYQCHSQKFHRLKQRIDTRELFEVLPGQLQRSIHLSRPFSKKFPTILSSWGQMGRDATHPLYECQCMLAWRQGLRLWGQCRNRKQRHKLYQCLAQRWCLHIFTRAAMASDRSAQRSHPITLQTCILAT